MERGGETGKNPPYSRGKEDLETGALSGGGPGCPSAKKNIKSRQNVQRKKVRDHHHARNQGDKGDSEASRVEKRQGACKGDFP